MACAYSDQYTRVTMVSIQVTREAPAGTYNTQARGRESAASALLPHGFPLNLRKDEPGRYLTSLGACHDLKARIESIVRLEHSKDGYAFPAVL